MIQVLEDVLKIAKIWPEEDPQALAAAAHEIQAQRTGVCMLSDDAARPSKRD